MANRQRVALAGINVRGLKRRGFDHDTIQALRGAQRSFLPAAARGTSGLRSGERVRRLSGVGQFVDFLKAAGNRPLALPRRHDMSPTTGSDRGGMPAPVPMRRF